LRIDNNVRTGAVGARSAARNGSASPAFNLGDTGAAPRAAAAGSAHPAAGIGALLALQAVEDPLLKKKKLVRRGRSLLDALDSIKADLLAGHVGEGHLNLITALIGQVREEGDPALAALLDDIELRARVELAKRGLFPPF
jgi:hypothetical protein